MNQLRSAAVSLPCLLLFSTFLLPAQGHAQAGKTATASSRRSAAAGNGASAQGSAYALVNTSNGGSLYLGDQPPGNQNGNNTVAGIGTGGQLSPGSTGYGGQLNTLLGSSVAGNAVTARETTCIGAFACYSLIGSNGGVEDTIITAVGSQAAASLTNDVLSSVFFGQKAGISLQHSYYDAFIGTHAGANVAASNNTTIVGNFAADGASLGGTASSRFNLRESVIIGAEAYESPTSTVEKTQDTVVGSRALPYPGASSGNSVFGFSAGRGITDGQKNGCLGFQCMYGVSSGRNVSLTGTGNYGVGSNVLNSVTTGNYNIAFGSDTGTDMSTGSYNALFGWNTGNRVGSGTRNWLFGGGNGNRYNYNNVIAIGWQSCISPDDGMVCIGDRAGANNAGTGNLYIGRNAGQYITSGSNNIVIGQDAAQYTSGSDSGNTLIGNNAQINAGCNNTVQIGTGMNQVCGTVQLGANQFMNANGQLLTKGAMLLPAEIFHITTDGSTTVSRTLANWSDDASVSFGARNATAAANMNGVYATSAVHGTLTITVPAVPGMQFDVTVTEVKN